MEKNNLIAPELYNMAQDIDRHAEQPHKLAYYGKMKTEIRRAHYISSITSGVK